MTMLTRATLAAALLLCAASMPCAAAQPEPRRYCLSDICPGDARDALARITLGSLAGVADRPRAPVKRDSEALKAALPELTDTERLILSAYRDSKGSFLLDARTLPVFLKIGRICAPVGPFVALFTSESGHTSIIEFGATRDGTKVRLGVTRIARAFKAPVDSADEIALIADLSRKFGYRVDAAPETQLSGSGGVTAEFTRQQGGFLLAFASAPVTADAAEFAGQAGCDRIKID
jgi:hypothetical protein